MRKNYFDNYIQTLKKLDQKRFRNVLDLYPDELKPRHHVKAKQEIENNKKLSEVAKVQMLKFNNYILEELFISKEFVKECRGLNIGDIVFVDNSKKQRTIAEFLKKDEGVFVIFTDHSVIDPPCMIEMVFKEKRNDSEGESYFYNLKESSIFDDIDVAVITADISHMLNEFALGTYDFNPVYQRDLVWSTEKKQAFVKKILMGDVELRPTLLDAPFIKSKREYEVLDGKQRMMAVIQFVQGQFPVDGFFYKDLSLGDVVTLMQAPFIYKKIKYYDKKKGFSEMTLKQKVELFLQVNEYGQKVSDEHLAKIKQKFYKGC